jgi:dTDP-4-amino-4,6-dideoxygalactose transaminase
MSPRALEDYLRMCRRDPQTGRPLGQRTGRPIKAIVPVHLYGQIADMDAILAISSEYDLIVIEDSAQAHGAEYRSADERWKRAGTSGKAAAFSFYPGKNLGACGEAGAVTTNDDDVATFIRMIREHGQSRKYYHDIEGYNGRLDAMQAAFLRVKLRHLDAWTAGRRAAAERYAAFLAPLVADGQVVLPYESPSSKPVYHLYVVRTKGRDALADHLKSQGIQTGLHYPLPVHLQKCYVRWGYREGSLPVTEQVASEVLSLPMFPGLTEQQQRRVASAIEQFLRVAAQW